MFCQNCGSELTEDARYCAWCGAETEGTAGETEFQEQPEGYMEENMPEMQAVRNNYMSDKVTDAIASKISGRKVQTIRISMEDMLALLYRHFIGPACTDAEYRKIQKTVNGGIFGITHLDSMDGNYSMKVSVAMQLGGRINIFHPSDSNWIIVYENSTGRSYQYSALFWGKFKKAVKNEIRRARR